MDMNLETYLSVYNNWLDLDQCNNTIKELDNVSWSQHKFYNVINDDHTAISGDKELDVSYGDTSTVPYFMQRVWDGYQRYITDLDFEWFQSWKGFSRIRFNKYQENRKMAHHFDGIHSIFDGARKGIPVMSALGILNDDYSGGEFIMWGKEIKLKGGDLVIFPSNFLYPHKVEPVTKGIRYSFVSWSW